MVGKPRKRHDGDLASGVPPAKPSPRNRRRANLTRLQARRIFELRDCGLALRPISRAMRLPLSTVRRALGDRQAFEPQLLRSPRRCVGCGRPVLIWPGVACHAAGSATCGVG
jgi:hypothetical protein